MAQQIGVPLQHSGSMSGLESRNKQAGGGEGVCVCGVMECKNKYKQNCNGEDGRRAGGK